MSCGDWRNRARSRQYLTPLAYRFARFGVATAAPPRLGRGSRLAVFFFLVLVILVGMRRARGLLVDAAFGERAELLVGSLLFVKDFLKKVGRLLVAHTARPGDERAVGGHLVVLRALPRGNQARVHRRLVKVLAHDRLAFFDDPRDAVAMFAARLLFDAFEDLLEPLDVSKRFLEMGFERRAQFGRVRRLGELRQGFRELFFRVVGIAQFVDERIVQGSGFSHVTSPSGCLSFRLSGQSLRDRRIGLALEMPVPGYGVYEGGDRLRAAAALKDHSRVGFPRWKRRRNAGLFQ